MRPGLGSALATASMLVASSTAAQGAEVASGASIVDPRPHAIPRAEDFESSRMVGAGLGLRAGAFGTTAVLANPANLALTQQYHAEAIAGYAPGEGSFTFGSVVADSSTSRMRAGVASRAIVGDGQRGYRGSDNRVVLGIAAGEHIGIGLGLRYLRLKSRGDTDDGYPEAPELRTVTLDASVRVTPVTGLHLAAFGYNLVRSGSLLAPTRLGAGIVYQYENSVQFGVDFLADVTTFRETTYLFGAGVEWWVDEQYPIRLGYARDGGRSRDAMTFGLGYVETRFGIELSLRQEFGSGRQSQLLFSARYAMEPESSP